LKLFKKISSRIDSFAKKCLHKANRPQMRSAQTLSDKDFLALFNLDDVERALKKKDMPGATEALLSHYRRRVSNGWLKFPGLLEEVSKLMEREDVPWSKDGSALSHSGSDCTNWPGFPVIDQPTMKKLSVWSDLVLENRVILGGLPEVFLGKEVNWHDHPGSGMQWTWTLNRHEWFPLLFQVHTQSKDNKYGDKIIELILDWLDKNSPPTQRDEESPGWRLMEVGMRMYLSWIPAFGLLYELPSFTDRAKLKVLRGICDHGRFLSLFHTNRNHLLRESIGLAYVGVYFPEFKEADRWRETAFSRLAQELSMQFNRDGSHIEMATAYQWLVATEYQYLYDLLESTHQSLPGEDLGAWLERMYHLLANVMRPNFTFPQLNDGFTDPNYALLHKLVQAGRKLKRSDFVYAGTNGSEGPCPKERSVAFDDAGLYVMRSDWSRNARYLLFDAGPYGGPHGHEDKLSIEICAFGQVFIADPGTYTYDWEDPFRSYFVSSLSHNVVTVDGKSQIRRWDQSNMDPKPARGNYAAWMSCSQYDYVAASYENGYSEFSPKPTKGAVIDDVIHRRRILFVKPDYWLMVDELEAGSPHVYSLLFHAPPGMEARVRQGKRVVLSSSTDGACLEIIPAYPENVEVRCVIGSEDPIQGWCAGSGYHSKWPATVVTFTHKRALSVTMATLLYPSPACRTPESITLKPLPLRAGEGMAFAAMTPRGEDYLLLSENEGLKEFGNYRTRERISVIRNDRA
jgi:Heparinase II/III N-terminus/Heparinase II/III-like protein